MLGKRLFLLLLGLFLLLGIVGYTQYHLAQDNVKDGLLVNEPSFSHDVRAAEDAIGGNWMRSLSSSVGDVQGDLLWSPSRQQGVARIIGLPKLEEGENYQILAFERRTDHAEQVELLTIEHDDRLTDIYWRLAPKKRLQLPYKFELLLLKPGADPQPLMLVQP